MTREPRRRRARRRPRRPGRRARPRGGGRRRARARGARAAGRPRRAAAARRRPAVQLGGEIVGPFQTAYLGLVAELGLTLEASYIAEAGETQLRRWPRASCAARAFSPAPSRPSTTGSSGRSRRWRRTVDPDDPWAHPEAAAPGRHERGELAARERRGRRRWCAARELFHLSMSGGSVERTSLLAALRQEAAAGRDRVLRLRRVGEPAGRRGLGHGRRADGRRARRRGCASARRCARSTCGRPLCSVTLDGRRARRRRGGGLRAAGRPAARRRA